MARTQLVVADDLVAEAAEHADLPAGAGLAALARYAMAKLAGWSDGAARSAARALPRGASAGVARPAAPTTATPKS